MAKLLALQFCLIFPSQLSFPSEFPDDSPVVLVGSVTVLLSPTAPPESPPGKG